MTSAVCPQCYASVQPQYGAVGLHNCARSGCPFRQQFKPLIPPVELFHMLDEKCAHRWDGPDVEIGNGTSITCSKCGLSAYAHSLRNAP